jgi:hypothetical protein
MRLMIFVALWICGNSFAEGTGKIVGQLGMLEGDVFIDQRMVSRNSPIREGATIEVKKGKATLLLGTGSVFHLTANTKMVVNQFGIRKDSKKEGGDVNLHFGRTRALIQNKGSETKDVRIITRMATMGVRGTEVFVDVPEDPSRPVQFFTMEGLAKVEMPSAPPVDLKQNQGVSTVKADGSGDVVAAPPKLSLNDVKQEIKNAGIEVAAAKTPVEMKKSLGDFNGNPPPNVPFPRFDPIQDRIVPLRVQPRYCNATTGQCQ